MKTNCTRYDPNTGNCKLTNSQAECGYDCAGYSYIPDNFNTHPGFTAKNEDVVNLTSTLKTTGGNYAR